MNLQPPAPLRLHLAYALWLTALGALPVFLGAASLSWRLGWVFVGLLAVEHLGQALALWKWNPSLIRHRLARKPGVPAWDRRWMLVHGLNSLALLVLPGLEHYLSGSRVVEGWTWGLAALCHVAGASLTAWAMAVNPHFEGAVRHQDDRTHAVVGKGPYQWVRHPGYTGFLLLILPVPWLLGSTWALIPAGLALGLLAWRTFREDTFLSTHLNGYPEYTQKVRNRLVPGLW